MLNSELVENFHAIYRQKQTGSLNASGDDFNIRFLFQNGEVMAMDLGEDKEHLLADKLREYHRLDQAQHALVFATRERVQGSVADIVRNLHLASDDEVAQITRAMVEDILCHAFGGKVRHLQFNPAQGMESFNFDRSAVRLRIGVDVLLKTVESRVSEIQAVETAVGGPESVFVFAEGAENAGELSDYEKHVLNFVDGHRTLEDVAAACRDGNHNLARIFNQLMKKGVVRKLPARNRSAPGATPSGPVATSASAPSAAGARPMEKTVDVSGVPAAATSAPAEAQPFVPYDEEPRGPNRGVLLALVALLVLAVGVLFLVHNYDQKQQKIKDMQDHINELVSKREWEKALRNVEALTAQANGDLSNQQLVADLRAHLQQAMLNEMAGIQKLIDVEEFGQASQRLGNLPPSAEADEVRRKLAVAMESFNQQSKSLEAKVTEKLDKNDVAGALHTIAATSKQQGAAATTVLERWRIKKLEDASASGAPLSKRLEALNLVKSAQPSAGQKVTIAAIEEDLRRQQGHLKEQVQRLQELANKGDYDKVLEEIQRLRLSEYVNGTPLQGDFQKLYARCDQVRSEVQAYREKVLSSVRNAESAAVLRELQIAGDALLSHYPQASNRAATESLVSTLKDCLDCVEQPSDSQQVALQTLLERRNIDPDLSAAIEARMKGLGTTETEASLELENCRRLLRDGNWESAEHHFEDLIRKPEWQATAAHRTAEKELADERATSVKREASRKELEQAIAKGETSRATAIAREMGLKYLPLSIESIPTGAEVWQGSKKLGTTPLVLNLPAADRVDLTIELRLSGYQTKNVSGATAEGGWRLLTALERAPAAHVDLGKTVTGRPSSIKDRLWASNRSQAFAITLQGDVQTWEFESGAGNSALNDPIYAPAVAKDDVVYIATRENIAIRIGKTVERVPTAGGTDLAPAIFESPLLIDRRFLIVSGLDNALHGMDERHPTSNWATAPGQAFAASPVISGDAVLTVQVDGTLSSIQAYDGKILGTSAIGQPIVAAWVVDGKRLAGLCANIGWSWDGKELITEPLPQAAAGGAKDVIVGTNGRIWLRSGTEWKDMGRVDGTITGDPVVWRDHVAVPVGPSMRVLGARGFGVTQSADFLPPVVIGDKLGLVNQNGQVFIYDP
ncbi:MAG: hypothetical protein H0W83_01620 [Planctomycetes bacterium]|nr:hypothetical protein [Planctomycetota bacterium]